MSPGGPIVLQAVPRGIEGVPRPVPCYLDGDVIQVPRAVRVVSDEGGNVLVHPSQHREDEVLYHLGRREGVEAPVDGGAALELRTDAACQLRQHHLKGVTLFGSSSHRELKTLAIIVDAINDAHQQPRNHAHHVWVVVEAAVDFHIIPKLARQPLHKATDSSLDTHAVHLWMALGRLPKHVILNLVKQESHRYSLSNGHIDLHAHNKLAEHMPDGEDPSLQDHMHTHLQDLPPIRRPGEPPAWVPDDRIYNDTGQAYHYPQPIRTLAHIRGRHADNSLMNRLQHELQTALYLSALDPSLLPTHLQAQRAQLLLEQLPLLDRVARWYDRRGVGIPPEYTICPCHLQRPETWEHFKQCPSDPPETVRKLADLMRSHAKANMQTPVEPPLRDPGQQATHPFFKPHAPPAPLPPVPPKRARRKRGAPARNQAGKAATSRPPAPHPTQPANLDQASSSSSLPSLPPPHPDQASSSSSLPPPAPPPPEAYPGFEKGAKVQQPFRNDHTGDWIWCEGAIQYRLRDPGDNGGPQIRVVWHRQKELDQGSSAPDKPEGHTQELTSAHPIRLRTDENKAHRGTKYTWELPPEWSHGLPPPRLPKRPPTGKTSPSPSPPP